MVRVFRYAMQVTCAMRRNVSSLRRARVVRPVRALRRVQLPPLLPVARLRLAVHPAVRRPLRRLLLSRNRLRPLPLVSRLLRKLLLRNLPSVSRLQLRPVLLSRRRVSRPLPRLRLLSRRLVVRRPRLSSLLLLANRPLAFLRV